MWVPVVAVALAIGAAPAVNPDSPREPQTFKCQEIGEGSGLIRCSFRGADIAGVIERRPGTFSRPHEPFVVGALEKATVDAVVERQFRMIQYCYERRLVARPALGGEVVVRFKVASTGAVSTASISSSTADDPPLEDCLVGLFQQLQFPPPNGGGIAIVKYALLFSPT